MNKKSFVNIILASAIFLLFTGISQVYAVPVAPNKTNITAEVLSVQQIDPSSNFASNYVAILNIKVIKYESVEGTFSVPNELKVYVHKWTNDLAIVNKLENGQTITAAIFYSGDERGGIWDIREIKISTSTQTQCEIGKIYDNTAVSPVSCSCPAGYQFETVEIGFGPCPVAGISDCLATKLKCVAKTEIPTSTKEPVPTSTSEPVKIEVTGTETAVSGPQPVTAKIPAGCTRENETVTCPTSETKQISVPVIMSTNAPLEAITIQKQTDGTIGITSHGVIAVTTEKVTVEDNRLFIGSTESAKPVSVLPNEAKNTAITSAGLTSVAITELKTEEQKPIYSIQGARSSKLLFFIPVSIKTTTKIDAASGKVISIQKPWWSFLTRYSDLGNVGYEENKQGGTTNEKVYSVPGIQFRYPSNWQVTTKTIGVKTTATFVIPKKGADDLYGETFVVAYTSNQGGLTLEEWWSEASKNDRYQKNSETTIAGFSSYVLILPETDAPPRYILVTKSRAPGGWIYDITARGESVDKVLSTFRVTE